MQRWQLWQERPPISRKPFVSSWRTFLSLYIFVLFFLRFSRNTAAPTAASTAVSTMINSVGIMYKLDHFGGLRLLRFGKRKGQLALWQTRQGQRIPTVRLCKAVNTAFRHVIGRFYHNFQFPELCPGFCRRKQTGIRIEARCIARINGGIQRCCHRVFQCLPRRQREGVLIPSHQ